MQIEQLSMYDLMEVQRSYDFADLDGGHIYPKIDTLTFVFNDCTINQVLSWIKLDDYVGEFLNSRFVQDGGLGRKFVFVFNNVRVEAHWLALYNADPMTPVFDIVCPDIRLYLGGEALDYLRSLGIDFIDHRFVVPDLGTAGTFHCTRCDWAFDFVDYKPDFLDHLIEHLQNNSLPSGRVPLKNSAIKYSLKLGDQKTVYLGSTQGSKLLRCYDKKLQYYNFDLGLWSQDPYGDPESWYRIEWQLRNMDAHSLLFSRDKETGECNDYLSVLKQIFLYYSFTVADHDVNNYGPRPSVEFWQTFLPWEEITSKIVQNAKYVQSKSRAEKVKTFVEGPALRAIIEYITFYGKDAFNDVCREYLKNCHFMKDLIDPTAEKRRNALLSQLEELQHDMDVKIPDDNIKSGLYRVGGWLSWDL